MVCRLVTFTVFCSYIINCTMVKFDCFFRFVTSENLYLKNYVFWGNNTMKEILGHIILFKRVSFCNRGNSQKEVLMSEMKQLLFNQIVLNSEIVKIGDYRSVAHFHLFQVVEVTFRPVTKNCTVTSGHRKKGRYCSSHWLPRPLNETFTSLCLHWHRALRTAFYVIFRSHVFCACFLLIFVQNFEQTSFESVDRVCFASLQVMEGTFLFYHKLK